LVSLLVVVEDDESLELAALELEELLLLLELLP
jgi:hypothetical protein